MCIKYYIIAIIISTIQELYQYSYTSNDYVIAQGKSRCNLIVTYTVTLELHENTCGCLFIT